jgi:cytochrome c55X
MSNRAVRLLGALLVSASIFPAFAEEIAAERQAELVRLVRHDCGACHGLTLRGGLGPALLPENLQSLPPSSLVATILGGRPGTPMPPWRNLISEAEAEWIVARLATRFPE